MALRDQYSMLTTPGPQLCTTRGARSKKDILSRWRYVLSEEECKGDGEEERGDVEFLLIRMFSGGTRHNATILLS